MFQIEADQDFEQQQEDRFDQAEKQRSAMDGRIALSTEKGDAGKGARSMDAHFRGRMQQ